jgi:prevent-host-death family protein
MKTMVNIYDTKARLSELIRQVERTGRAVTVCRNGKPVVDLVAHREVADPLKSDSSLRGAVFHGDPCAPVDERDWPAEQR